MQLTVEGDDAAKAQAARAALLKQGIKKIVLVVPGYASKRYQLLYGSAKADDSMLVLVKPVSVSYFKADKWWSDDLSRTLMGREFYRTGLFYIKRFKHDEKGDSGKERVIEGILKPKAALPFTRHGRTDGPSGAFTGQQNR